MWKTLFLPGQCHRYTDSNNNHLCDYGNVHRFEIVEMVERSVNEYKTLYYFHHVFRVCDPAGRCSNAAATLSTGTGLSTVTRLALGTLKLEGTDQAVSTSQAAELITFWQAYQSLSNSDTSSDVELEALVKQIQG